MTADDDVLTDEQLVQASLEGANGAFEELVGRYRGRLLRFLVTRATSLADAEDAVQDTFINAYRYLASFDPRWRFSTWIYRIAIRNAAKQKRPEWHDSDVEVVDDRDPLDACIAHSDRQNAWRLARDRLSEDAYAAMWLRYVEDLSVKEVSRALDKSASWTKVTLMRARRRLTDDLAGTAGANVESESYG